MKRATKFLSIFLTAVMLLCAAPLASFTDLGLSIQAEAASVEVTEEQWLEKVYDSIAISTYSGEVVVDKYTNTEDDYSPITDSTSLAVEAIQLVKAIDVTVEMFKECDAEYQVTLNDMENLDLQYSVTEYEGGTIYNCGAEDIYTYIQFGGGFNYDPGTFIGEGYIKRYFECSFTVDNYGYIKRMNWEAYYADLKDEDIIIPGFNAIYTYDVEYTNPHIASIEIIEPKTVMDCVQGSEFPTDKFNLGITFTDGTTQETLETEILFSFTDSWPGIVSILNMLFDPALDEEAFMTLLQMAYNIIITGFDTTELGRHTATVYFWGKTATFEYNVVPEVESIKIETPPSTLDYGLNAEVSLDGLKVIAEYSDGSEADVTDKVTVTGFDALTSGRKTATVEYLGQTDTFDYNVSRRDATIEDEKTGTVLFIPADAFDGDVEVTVEESNEDYSVILSSIGNVANSKFYDISVLLDGEPVQPSEPITVKIPIPEGFNPETTCVYYINPETGETENMNAYFEDGYLVFEVTHFSLYGAVEIGSDPELISIEITTPPTATEFIYGKEVSYDGMTVIAKYSDGSEIDVTEDVTVSGFSSDARGEHTATVTYTAENGEEFTATFNYNVKFNFWQWLLYILCFGWLWM